MGSPREPTPIHEFGALPKPERADAARNRRHVLAATERLIAINGVAGLTMDDIATEAGVGKGTLYRRFGDKGGLAVALLNERERELQERIISGPPPLGPGASARRRLSTFISAYLDLVVSQLDLMLLSETSSPGARLQTGAYSFWRQHCTILLRDAGTPDPLLRAEMLLAALSAEQIRHWIGDNIQSVPHVTDRLSAAAQALSKPL